MRQIAASFAALLLCVIPTIGAAQTAASIQRDSAALAILSQSLTAAGGPAAIGNIRDFAGTGTITYFWAGKEVQGTATVRGRGLGQFRLDSQVPDGSLSRIVDNGQGRGKDAEGKPDPFFAFNALSLGGISFPYPRLLVAVNDPSIPVSYVGEAQVNGRPAYVVRELLALPDGDPSGVKGDPFDFYIDAATFLVVKTETRLRDDRNPQQTYRYEIEFSDYRSVNGVWVPSTIAERLGGQHTWSLHLDSVSFNNGLSDDDFELAN